MEEKTVSYEKNPEAKVSGIVMEFTVQSDKQEKLQKLIDAAFSKGFTYTGAGYGGYGDVSASVKTTRMLPVTAGK
jgi:hypothetical protein